MADDYIDYLECIEYGDSFLTEVDKLAGTSKLVDIPELKSHLSTALQGVAVELEKQGIKRSGTRIDRKLVASQAAALRKDIDKFYHYLASLDDDVTFDFEAFFEGGNLGALAALKPADVAQRAGEVLRGFSADANKSLPDAAKWKIRLEAAQSTLVSVLTGRGSSTTSSIQGTAALVAARQAFLVAYNGVAKRLIQAVLIQIGRKDDLRLYFKDLQVNESKKAEPLDASTEGPAPEGATP